MSSRRPPLPGIGGVGSGGGCLPQQVVDVLELAEGGEGGWGVGGSEVLGASRIHSQLTTKCKVTAKVH